MKGQSYKMPKPPATITSANGQKFIVYEAPGDTICLERLRASGRRDNKSLYQFSRKRLLTVLAALAVETAAIIMPFLQVTETVSTLA